MANVRDLAAGCFDMLFRNIPRLLFWLALAIWFLASTTSYNTMKDNLSTADANAYNALSSAARANERADDLEARLDHICAATDGSLGC